MFWTIRIRLKRPHLRSIHNLFTMSRRASSSSSPSSPRPEKRQKIGHLTSESFRNGVMLAPMVRSGTLPTRLMSLKHGATLVWSPEVVDKAILHAEREVDPVTGVISYNGVTKAIFSTHPIEKPYLIYQIGSADPELAVQAAQSVQQDVSGIDLNCGCPKSFSTHAGMGAALLTNPDLLCSILTALRAAMPPEITVSAKIRLLPDQKDTLKLVERIVNTGISNLTVHCRTRNMRPRERALIHRLREVVEFVESMGKGVTVIENGDCLNREDAIRVRDITGAHSCMIATAAESNPTVFSPSPLTDLIETFTPDFVRLGKYLGHHFSNVKFCASAFRGVNVRLKKTQRMALHEHIQKAKTFDDLNEFVSGKWNGDQVMYDIEESLSRRVNGHMYELEPPPPRPVQEVMEKELDDNPLRGAEPSEIGHSTSDKSEISAAAAPRSGETTPTGSKNPEPVTTNAPLMPAATERLMKPALISGEDIPTPSPTPALERAAFV